jgi:hypothetical protein
MFLFKVLHIWLSSISFIDICRYKIATDWLLETLGGMITGYRNLNLVKVYRPIHSWNDGSAATVK